MRPRFMNRGSCVSAVVPLDSVAIVPGFNEAPIHESGKFPRPVSPSPSQCQRPASMRPRFMNRGSAHRVTVPCA